MAARIAALAIFVMSLDLVVGYGGLATLGHSALFGIGAYAAGLLAMHLTGNPLIGLIAGALAGALLIIAPAERKIRIEVGYGLEGVLNDATCKRIIEEDITPRFRQQDFAGGILAGLQRMMRVIDGEADPETLARV